MFYLSAGRLDEAIALLEYTLDRDPANSAGHARLGNLYYFAGRLDEAIASSRTALMLSPDLTQESRIGRSQLAEAILYRGIDCGKNQE